jgi:hypothetical protein
MLSHIKLNLLHKFINEQNFNHFPSYKTVFESSTSTGDWKTMKGRFTDITQQLQNKFLSQFTDFHTRTNEFWRLQNPFAFDTYQVPMHMSNLKDAFTEENVQQIMEDHLKCKQHQNFHKEKAHSFWQYSSLWTSISGYET